MSKTLKILLIVAGLVIIGVAVYLTFKFYNKDRGMPGSDQDEHGCIGSAGYSWCQAKEKCLRSWEEECK